MTETTTPKIASKTFKTPIVSYEPEFNRNYVYNRTFIRESIRIVEDYLNNVWCGAIDTHFTRKGRAWLASHEDALIFIRNMAIWKDYTEVQRALDNIAYDMKQAAKQ